MTKKDRYLLLMVGVFVVIGAAFAIGGQSDLNGERVTHTSCIVTEKPKTAKSKDQAHEAYHYHIDSTCGSFLADKDLYDSISVDGTYDLVTTKGNWAHNPSLLSAQQVF